ncbi:MAG TPA: hypothetical protein VFP54_11880 [Acidimicrobiales bacterium]|nr:hypothetical protein [Acidimicrobiales bacterium]
MRRAVAAASAITAVMAVIAAPSGAAHAQRSPAWTPSGYWVANADGAVSAFGGAPDFGSAAGVHLNRPVLGMAATPDARGYWLVAGDGGIFTYGDAGFFGSTGGMRLNQPVVGIAATPDGGGYWLVASDGGVFSFGDASFWGSTGSLRLNRPIVGLAPTPSGRGYWLVASDGGVFAFGDAAFLGSEGGANIPAPVTSIEATPSGHGYWMTAAGGLIYAFGDAAAAGGPSGVAAPIVSMAPTPDGQGYWVLGSDGGVLTYGGAPYAGRATPGSVAIVAVPPRPPARTAAFYYPWYANPTVDGAWRHWDEGGHTPPLDIGSDYYPTRGAYSSHDPSVVDAQMADMAGAGIDEVIASWWGRGSFEDQALPILVPAAAGRGLRLAAHIEPYQGRTAASVGQDIEYLHTTYGITDFFVYRAQDFTAGDWAPVLGAISGVTVWAESFWDGLEAGWVQTFAAQAGFGGVYTYDPYDLNGADFAAICGAARENHLLCSPSVAPGFSAYRATGQTANVPRLDGATYDQRWAGASHSDADLITITSYNEWHEGSQMEPAADNVCAPDGSCYLNYDGAYGLTGPAASTAYLTRTRSWDGAYRNREGG